MAKKINWVDRQVQWMKMQVNRPIYCKLCGMPIEMWSNYNNPTPTDYEWERANEVHAKCYMDELRKRQNGNRV